MFPIDKKGGVHEALYLLFRWYVVPPNIIVDGFKEQTLVVFKHKVAEVGCHLRQMEP